MKERGQFSNDSVDPKVQHIRVTPLPSLSLSPSVAGYWHCGILPSKILTHRDWGNQPEAAPSVTFIEESCVGKTPDKTLIVEDRKLFRTDIVQTRGTTVEKIPDNKSSVRARTTTLRSDQADRRAKEFSVTGSLKPRRDINLSFFGLARCLVKRSATLLSAPTLCTTKSLERILS